MCLNENLMLPNYVHPWHRIRGNPLISNQRSYDPDALRDEAAQLQDSLNHGQRESYDQIVDSVLNHRNKLFFVSGSGGTGKTYL